MNYAKQCYRCEHVGYCGHCGPENGGICATDEKVYKEVLLMKIGQVIDLLGDISDSRLVEQANMELGLGNKAMDLEGVAEEMAALAGQFKELHM